VVAAAVATTLMRNDMSRRLFGFTLILADLILVAINIPFIREGHLLNLVAACMAGATALFIFIAMILSG
jgi:hypothetical protein